MQLLKREEAILLEAKGKVIIEEQQERVDIMEQYALSYEYLHTTNLYLYQGKQMFRNNSDTTQLALFMKIHKGESVLDIGTNNASLLLYASMYQPAQLIGVEIQEEACCIASLNMRMHQLEANIIHADIKEVVIDKVDAIICNPPYFDYDAPFVNRSNSRHIARHTNTLSMDTLAMKIKQLLRDNGRFYLVHRAEYVAELIILFSQYGLINKRMQFVYAKNKGDAKSVLLEFRKIGKEGCIVESAIIL